jgi:hypothetical protein
MECEIAMSLYEAHDHKFSVEIFEARFSIVKLGSISMHRDFERRKCMCLYVARAKKMEMRVEAEIREREEAKCERESSIIEKDDSSLEQVRGIRALQRKTVRRSSKSLMQRRTILYQGPKA